MLCLAGENGCGKSTLIKIISGVYRPEPGAEMLFDGKPMDGLTPGVARALGIQVIWQDLALFPEMTVAENIAFEQNLGDRPRLVDYGAMREVAAEAAGAARRQHSISTRPVRELSIAQRQIVAICRALIGGYAARLHGRADGVAQPDRRPMRCWTIVRRLSADGIAVVFVSHRLAEVLEVCSRVTVLRDGRSSGLPDRGHDADPADRADDRPDLRPRRARRDRSAAPVVLEVEEPDPPRRVSGCLASPCGAARSLGITGLLGAGRTELALSLFGMTRPDCGHDPAEGQPLRLAVQPRRDRGRHRLRVGGSAVARAWSSRSRSPTTR